LQLLSPRGSGDLQQPLQQQLVVVVVLVVVAAAEAAAAERPACPGFQRPRVVAVAVGRRCRQPRSSCSSACCSQSGGERTHSADDGETG
jgi:hypothetical protein